MTAIDLDSAPERPATEHLADGGSVIDRAIDAALALARDRPWSEISLRDIARAAGVPFAELYARAPDKRAVIERLSRRDDLAAVALAEDEAGAAHDRLFEAVMARVETLQPHRAAIIAIAGVEGMALAPLLPRTAKALLEAAGIDSSGPRGAARTFAMTRIWARTLRVWRDDEGALNRTMAEIDRLLKRADRRLSRIRAGWSQD